MGEMAEYHLEQALSCDEYSDGLDFDMVPRIKVNYKTCKFCHIGSLHWEETKKGWRLFDDHGKIHNCSVNPLKKEELV